MKTIAWTLFAGVALMSLSPATAGAAVKITLVGDSTVANYPATSTLVGWGQVLSSQFRPGTVTISNQAVGGQSSKSYINSGYWTTALATDPDYVFIQFGHNDNATGDFAKPTNLRTFPEVAPVPIISPLTTRDYYRNNISKYVADARAAGAVPIIVLAMERHVYDTEGMIKRLNEPYTNAAYDVATALGVEVIDLHSPSIALYESLGNEASAYLHAEGGTDQSHFSLAGANLYANWIAADLRVDGSPLAALLVPEPTGTVGVVGIASAGLLKRRRAATRRAAKPA